MFQVNCYDSCNYYIPFFYMDVKKFTVCNRKIEKDSFKKDRNICKNCYNITRKIYNITTFSRNDNNEKKGKVVDSVNNTNNSKKKTKVVESLNRNKNRTLIIGFSNCGKTYLMIYILLQKQEPIFLFRNSLNHFPNIKAQTSDEIKPLQNYENSTIVFDDMLLSKQESNIDLFFTQGRHSNIDIHYISQSYFNLPKNTIRNNTNIFFFKQTLRDIILILHDIAGIDMNLQEWKELRRKACENDYD